MIIIHLWFYRDIDKNVKIYTEGNIALSTFESTGIWENWESTYRIIKLNIVLGSHSKQKFTPNWLMIATQSLTQKLLEEKLGTMLQHLGIGNEFLKRTQLFEN